MDDLISKKSENSSFIANMPRSLTAENGAKELLMGEFKETIEVSNPEYCGCGECSYCIDFPLTEPSIMVEIPIRWTTIKEIYAKIVEHYADK
jgi:hypothetical protein